MTTKSVQQPLPPMLLANPSQPEPVRTIQTQADSEAVAATLFDHALTSAGLQSKEVAQLFGVSESLVNRMRSPHHRERVSFPQLLRLPPPFHLALHKAMNKRFGFGRAALRELLDCVGLLAVAVAE